MRFSIVLCLTILGILILSVSLAMAEGFGFPGIEETGEGAVSSPMTRAADLASLKSTIWYFDFTIQSSVYFNRLNIQSTYETVDGKTGLIVTSKNTDGDVIQGHCFLGSDFGISKEYHCAIANPAFNTVLYLDFDRDVNNGSGVYYYKTTTTGQTSSSYPLTLTLRSYVCSSSTSTPEGVYYVPFVPKTADYLAVGFGLSNADNASTNSILVEYYNNAGQKLGQQSMSIPANRQISFLKTVTTAEDGWAKITSSKIVYGMSLVFGEDETPFFDVDITNQLSQNLVISHMDTTGYWNSYAMLCNPSSTAADVTMTFYPSDTAISSTSQSLIIPGKGSVQYNLESFGSTGTVKVVSTQAIAGFLMFDGRESPNNWLGGLSIDPQR